MHCKRLDICKASIIDGVSVFPKCIMIGRNQENLLLPPAVEDGGLVPRAVNVQFRRVGNQMALLRVAPIERERQIL